MASQTAEMRLLDLRPEHVRDKLGSKSKVCLLNSHDIFKVIRDEPTMIMACNIRIKHVIPGIMKAAEVLDAVVAFELAKSEGDLNGGYTGQTPQIFFDTVISYAEERRFSKPFFIHADHITVKDISDKAFQEARELINAQLEAGFTSFAIDASFNEMSDNIDLTVRLAEPIAELGLGLEAEVGEIKSVGQEAELSTVEEALEFIAGLRQRRIQPDVLGINNGSKHGNYLPGEEVNIDLERTGDIYQAVRKYGVAIAQHGITGTPKEVMAKFVDYGIRKGNVGTEWQNIAHAGLPKDLFEQMKKWCEENRKDLKFATKPFKKEIDLIDINSAKKIEDQAYQAACEYFELFRVKGLASKVMHKLVG